MAGAGRSPSLSPTVSLTQAIKFHRHGCPFYTQRKGTSSSPKTKGYRKESEHTRLSFPQFTTIASYSCTHPTPPQLCALHQTWHKIVSSASFGLHFLMTVPRLSKTHIKCVCFPPVNLSLSV